MMIDLIKESLEDRRDTVIPALYATDANAQKSATTVIDTALSRIKALIEPTVKNIASQMQDRPDFTSSLTISFLLTMMAELQTEQDQDDILNQTIADIAQDVDRVCDGEIDVEPLKKVIHDEVCALQDIINRFHTVYKIQHEPPAFIP